MIYFDRFEGLFLVDPHSFERPANVNDFSVSFRSLVTALSLTVNFLSINAPLTPQIRRMSQ